jgi:SAM-dependent methyltransferase
LYDRRHRPAAATGEASLFHRAYVRIAGRHPNLRPWHFQWLAGQPLYDVLRPLLAGLRGDVLDVGCGAKPYRSWVPGARRYFGIDVFPGPDVDAVIEPGRPWPVEDEEFDVVLCTQVLEHVGDVDLTIGELVRALRPGGVAVISVPFIFGEHNSPHDYRRLSRHGARRLLEDRLEVVGVHPHGAIGSTLAAILLGWTWDAMPRRGLGALALAPLLPFWLVLCLGVNIVGWALDRVDRTGLYYGNVIVHARKRRNDHSLEGTESATLGDPSPVEQGEPAGRRRRAAS